MLLLIRMLASPCRDRRPRLSEKTKILHAENKEITPTDFCLPGLIFNQVSNMILNIQWHLWEKSLIYHQVTKKLSDNYEKPLYID